MFEKELAKIIAEKSAVKSGKQLNQDEVNAIVNELFKLENPIYAPNGKKVLITLDEQEIFRQLD
jgi:DNA mismatch repair ATPase MutL